MIDKNTFQFLSNLAENNNRDWFLANKSEYELAKQNIETFADELLLKLRGIDNSIAENITGKKSVMRIYRDVRFSKDKTPYKNNFGIWFSTRGKNADCPGYFVQIQPGKSFLAGGYWMPQTEHLKAIRQEIDYNSSQLLSIIENKDFIDFFGGLSLADKLKTSPKGYPSDHEYVELLKLKSFTAARNFNDNEMMDITIMDELIKGFSLILPLTDFIKNAID
jgi:uncharacterized protein (TIGR02453 family)